MLIGLCCSILNEVRKKVKKVKRFAEVEMYFRSLEALIPCKKIRNQDEQLKNKREREREL